MYADINGNYSSTVTSGNFIITASSAASTSGTQNDNNTVTVCVGGSLTEDITTFINVSSPTCP